MPGLEMAADRGQRRGEDRSVVGEADAHEQVRHGICRQDEVGDRSEQDGAHPRRRRAVHGAVVAGEQVLGERDLRHHAPELGPEPALVRRPVGDRQMVHRHLAARFHGVNRWAGLAAPARSLPPARAIG
jgi:hypothetical protein